MPELPLHVVEPLALDLEEPVSELVDEEQVAPAVGKRLQSLPSFVELRLLSLDFIPQREQCVEELLVVPRMSPDNSFGTASFWIRASAGGSSTQLRSAPTLVA